MRSGLFCVLSVAAFIASHSVSADSAAHVYECTMNGQRVFSDHSCGDDAIQRDVLVANTMEAAKVTSEKPAVARKSHAGRRVSSGDDHDKRRQQCAHIQKSRDALNDKMRAGYTARQDERLHDRLRKLDHDYFQLRCSGVR